MSSAFSAGKKRPAVLIRADEAPLLTAGEGRNKESVFRLTHFGTQRPQTGCCRVNIVAAALFGNLYRICPQRRQNQQAVQLLSMINPDE